MGIGEMLVERVNKRMNEYTTLLTVLWTNTIPKTPKHAFRLLFQ